MNSKKTAASKRTSEIRTSDFTKKFKKDWERLSLSGRYDMKKLKEVMLLLISNEGPLGPEWSDHQLSGNWEGYRECHVGGDFLLIYQIETRDKEELIMFVRTGTHADLF